MIQSKKLDYLYNLDKFIVLVARSKEIWLNPELLSLVVAATCPHSAYIMVFKKTNKRREAHSARWLAVAFRDYETKQVLSAIRYISLHKMPFRKMKAFFSNPNNCKEWEK